MMWSFEFSHLKTDDKLTEFSEFLLDISGASIGDMDVVCHPCELDTCGALFFTFIVGITHVRWTI